MTLGSMLSFRGASFTEILHPWFVCGSAFPPRMPVSTGNLPFLMPGDPAPKKPSFATMASREAQLASQCLSLSLSLSLSIYIYIIFPCDIGGAIMVARDDVFS